MENTENKNRCFSVKVKDGILDVIVSTDPDYPGIDIEYIADNEDKSAISRPRVLVEFPRDDKLRALIWNNPQYEDYTNKIDLI